ncbi:tripartite motif-containing protein 12A-like [Mytilus edulis]|uniref:tripartite motif-containing protein 12A-like n=1 Tax=Mytilus edulis TaxID=6550 RepID=UPI0039EE20C3
MVSKLNTKCGPCGYDDTKKNAKKWCAICEEGFCEECEKSHKSMNVSRNHKMISIEDYFQIHDIAVNLNCGIHGKRLDLYCKKHDTPVCVICISSEHKSCASSDVISIDEASQHAKKSIALSDLEETISKSLENAKDCINDRKMALKTMDKEEQAIRKMIKDTRMCLNTYLDELERNLLLDLTSKHVNCTFKYTKILNRLKQIEKEIVNIREQTLQMKRFKSDLKVFLGTHQLNIKILEKMGSLKEEIKDSTNNRIAIEIHPMINSLLKEVKRFGVIKVTETKAGLELKDAKVDQAQIQIHGTLQDICNISLQLKQKFDLKQPTKSITGCIVLPDNRIIIADYFGSGKLIEYNIDGNNIREIPVSDEPYDLTAVATDRIAGTYGSFQ